MVNKLISLGRPNADNVSPSDYVWDGMDSDVAHGVLGRLLDFLFDKGILSAEEIVEIIWHPDLSVAPSAGDTPSPSD